MSFSHTIENFDNAIALLFQNHQSQDLEKTLRHLESLTQTIISLARKSDNGETLDLRRSWRIGNFSELMAGHI